MKLKSLLAVTLILAFRVHARPLKWNEVLKDEILQVIDDEFQELRAQLMKQAELCETNQSELSSAIHALTQRNHQLETQLDGWKLAFSTMITEGLANASAIINQELKREAEDMKEHVLTSEVDIKKMIKQENGKIADDLSAFKLASSLKYQQLEKEFYVLKLSLTDIATNAVANASSMLYQELQSEVGNFIKFPVTKKDSSLKELFNRERDALIWEMKAAMFEASKLRKAAETPGVKKFFFLGLDPATGKPARVTWIEARKYCSARNMSLATIDSSKDVEPLKTVMRLVNGKDNGFSIQFWLDGTSLGFSQSHTENFYYSSSLTPVGFEMWKGGQPDKHNRGDVCLAIWSWGLQNPNRAATLFGDWDCNRTLFNFVCQTYV